jgi:hypothetical protein
MKGLCPKLLGVKHMPEDIRKILIGEGIDTAEPDVFNFF